MRREREGRRGGGDRGRRSSRKLRVGHFQLSMHHLSIFALLNLVWNGRISKEFLVHCVSNLHTFCMSLDTVGSRNSEY